MERVKKSVVLRILFVLALAVTVFVMGFLWFGRWPDPAVVPVPWVPDAIVVLGGEDRQRGEEAVRVARRYPSAPVIVTGDGGLMRQLIQASISPDLPVIEPSATSTYENATLTAPMLEGIGAKRVLIVTSWFHAQRALAVFRNVQPTRQFAMTFNHKTEPVTPWESEAQRRERFACVAYFFQHGIWCF